MFFCCFFFTFVHVVVFPLLLRRTCAQGSWFTAGLFLRFLSTAEVRWSAKEHTLTLGTCLRAYVPISIETQNLKSRQWRLYCHLPSWAAVRGQHGADSPAVNRSAYALQPIDAFCTAVVTRKHTPLFLQAHFVNRPVSTHTHTHTGSYTAGHHFSGIVSSSVCLNICILALCWFRETNNSTVHVVHSQCVLGEAGGCSHWFPKAVSCLVCVSTMT